MEKMPRMKTHQGAPWASRWKNCKVMRRRAGHNHMLGKNTPQQKRRLDTESDVTRSDQKKPSVFSGRGSMARASRGVHARREAPERSWTAEVSKDTAHPAASGRGEQGVEGHVTP